MIQQMFNMIMTAFMARFMLNDVPHLIDTPTGNLDLLEKLPPTPRERPFPPFYSPKWVAMHEDVPRYFYHVPEGKVEFGREIKAYKIHEPEFADTFGKGYAEGRYVWLSLKVIYPASDAYIIDITKLNNDDMRFTGQAEGNLLHRGDVPPSAVVGIRRRFGKIILREEQYKGGNPSTRWRELWQPIQIGDVVNIKTWMPRRADLRNYVVVHKPTGEGYEGVIIRKARGFGGTTAEMYIPANTLVNVEIIGKEELYL